jgi:hypothetical protein
MAHDIQSSVNIRHRRWRARQKEKKLAAIAEAKRLRRIELDNARVARGLLPLKLAKAESLAKFRAKQKKLRELVNNSWFGPEIDMEVVMQQRIAESPNLDPDTVRSFVESQARNCVVNYLNLNAFVLKRGFHIACHQRTVTHELIESGVPIQEAVERATREPFVPNASLSEIPRALDTCKRFDDARDKLGDGSCIADALLNRKRNEEVMIVSRAGEAYDARVSN